MHTLVYKKLGEFFTSALQNVAPLGEKLVRFLDISLQNFARQKLGDFRGATGQGEKLGGILEHYLEEALMRSQGNKCRVT